MLRLKNVYGLILLLGVLGACRAPKQRVLRGADAPAIRFDAIAIEQDTISPTSLTDAVEEQLGKTLPLALTTADKIAMMMRAGVNRNADWAEAIHYDIRKPNFVIIHHTAQNSAAQTIRTFQLPHTKVSAHYVIGRDGQVVQMLNDYLRSWHAGLSKWGNVTDMNSISLGIELDNNGKEPFPDQQIEALLTLLDTLKTKYRIPPANFLGHADIAPARKNDPSSFFPWKKLADRGFGLWYDERNLLPPPPNFNYVDALRIIGYDVTRLNATIVAFKRKFVVTDTSAELTDYDRKILYNLYRLYL